MAIPVTTMQAARNMFQTGMEQIAQQSASRLRAYATVKTGCTGKSQAHRKILAAEMQESTGRLQPTVGQELLLTQRYLFPRKATLTTYLDEDDAGDLDLQVAPTGEIGEQHRSAASRKIDDILIAGIIGTNYEGIEESIQPVSLPNSQIVAPDYVRSGTAVNSGLTLGKLIYGKGKFGKNEIYGQEQKQAGAKICMAVSQDELDNLLFDVEQIGSSDYNKVKALVDGEVEHFMGIHFMRTERLPTSAPSGGKIIRTCPMWVSTGVHLDFWYDVSTKITDRNDLSDALQIRSKLKAGACRKQEEHVVLLQCQQNA